MNQLAKKIEALSEPAVNPKAQITLNLVELSALHGAVAKAYAHARKAQEAVDAARAEIQDNRIQTFQALSELEDRIEQLELGLGIRATKFLTRQGWLCRICANERVSDSDQACDDCSAQERAR